MFTIDRQRFFSDWPARVRLPLTESRRKGVEFLLDAFERDQTLTMIRELAYVLATIRWESGHTFDPVRERRASAEKNPRLFALQERYWPSGFFGRGYVQMTWEKNYRVAGTRLAGESFTIKDAPVTFTALTLVQNPDYLLERAVSYRIAVRGMREGWFTGKKLSQYITDAAPPDYVNARRIINGTDRATEIAAMANEFELLLRGATTVAPATVTIVAEVTPAATTDDSGASRPLTRSLRRIGSMLGGGAARVRNVTRRLAARRRGDEAASPPTSKSARKDSQSERSPKTATGTANRGDPKPSKAKSAAGKRSGAKASTQASSPRREASRKSTSKSAPKSTAKSAPKRPSRSSPTRTR